MDDEARFDRLFVTSMPELARRMLRLGASGWEAEDLVNDLYLRLRCAPGARRAVVTHPNPAGYLRRAAANLWYDRWKQYRQRQRLFDRLVVQAEVVWDGGVDRWENHILVENALQHLSSVEATTVILVDLCGVTLDRAAEILGVHRGTVHRNRLRALERMRHTVGSHTSRQRNR
jgi:RNA polymerase sigma factor (sigma-70 family)